MTLSASVLKLYPWSFSKQWRKFTAARARSRTSKEATNSHPAADCQCAGVHRIKASSYSNACRVHEEVELAADRSVHGVCMRRTML